MDNWGFWAACAVGFVVILLFAKDQFNRPSWDPEHTESHLTRILSVPELRGDRVRRRALLVYTLLMSVVYAISIVLLSTGALGIESFQGGDQSPDKQAGADPKLEPKPDQEGASSEAPRLPDPWVPLAVSVGMIGLAPRSKFLLQIETKIRERAHEMMGLPAGLFSAGQAIADADVSLAQIGIGRHITKRYPRGSTNTATRRKPCSRRAG